MAVGFLSGGDLMAWTRNRFRDVVPKGSREQKLVPASGSPQGLERAGRSIQPTAQAVRHGNHRAAMAEVARLRTDPQHIRLPQAELVAAVRSARERMGRTYERLERE